ncbi:MAG: TonB-dependent receptor [Ekhidna sp.]|nr:TonB-dependent receptor [Ekhidna sp.]MBC6409474.1 TonB-dependent receptor [Ekhidna sp.]
MSKFYIILYLTFLLVSATVFAQSSRVTGIIQDEGSGEPLIGVTVIEKGTTNGTISDMNGRYSIEVPSNSILVISYVGFETSEIALNGRSQIDVSLKKDVTQLSEVIIVGYSSQNRQDITGAVSSVNVDDIQRLPGGNVSNLLQGQVAGVISTPGSGAPGAAPVIRIRGLGTIGNNNPLFVIDGVPADINSINPSDIESINVLKDASAATIYGSRASNGVVIVTTKRGKSGKPVVSFTAYTGWSSVPNTLDVLNTAGNNQVSNAAHANDGLDPLAYTSLTEVADTDWQNEMFQTGFEQKYDLAVSGGSDYAAYNLAFGYFSDEGTVIETDFERFNFRLNTDYNISERIRMGQTISYARSNRNLLGEDESGDGGNAGFSPILSTLEALPHNEVFDASTIDGFAVPVVGSGNIVGTTTLTTRISENDQLQGNAFIEFDIIDGLKFRTQFGVNVFNNFFRFHSPTYQFGPQTANDMADLSETRSRTTENVWNNVVEYNKSLEGGHTITALIGTSLEKRIFQSTGGSNNDFPSNKLRSLNAGIGDANSSGSNVTSTIESIFGQAGYNYKDKYLVQGSIRRDGSSRFGSGNRYGTFSSVSLGWRISEESFFNVPFINDLKPRFSIGTLGNQNISNFLFIATLSSNNSALNYPLGGAQSQAVNVGTINRSLASTDIKWEESNTMNYGVDLQMFENRIGIIFDYFITETTDMLVGVPVPATSGIIVDPITNGGNMENKGWELTLSYRNSESDFKYNISANLASSENKVTKLGFQDEAFVDGFVIFDTHPTTRTEVGGEIGRFHLFKTNGIFQTEEEVTEHGVQPNAVPGDLRFVDTNGDGVLNDDDKQFMGSGLPDLEYGLTFNASFKNFDFTLFFQGSSGNQIYNGTNVLLYRRQGDAKNFSADLLNTWNPSNTGSSIPRVTTQDPNRNIRPSDYFLEDGSYLRVKNIQLGYTFNNIVNGITKARIYAGAENLLTITGYNGFDPGLSNYPTFARGVDRGLYPLARTYLLGVQVTF